MGRKICLIISAVAAVVLLCLIIVYQNSFIEKSRELEEMNERVMELQQEQIRLSSERSALMKDYEIEVVGNGTLQIVFTAPTSDVYDTAYLAFQEYSNISGVIAINESLLPDREGMMTAFAAQEMASVGWNFCYYVSEAELSKYGADDAAVLEYLSSINHKAEEMGLTVEPAVYFKDGEYRSEYVNALKAAGMKVVIHHQEDASLELIATEESDGMWFVGGVGWRSSGAPNNMNIAANSGGSLVFTIGNNSETEEYLDTSFHAMLKKIEAYIREGSLTVGGFDDMISVQNIGVTADYIDKYETRMKEISDRLDEIKRIMGEISEEYGRMQTEYEG